MAYTGNEIITINVNGNVEEITLNDLIAAVKDLLEQQSTDVGQFPPVESLVGIRTLPAIRMAGATAEIVTVSVSLLKGENGKSIETRVTTGENAAWEYRQEDGEWYTLMTVADIQKPAVDAASAITTLMNAIEGDWNKLKPELSKAIKDAEEAAANVKDGKTPAIENGDTTDVPHGQPSKLVLVNTGEVDEQGNPIYQFRADLQEGPAGKSFRILGHYNTLTELEAAIPDGSNVDGAYGIGITPPYNYYIWGYDAANDRTGWLDQGKLEGAAGEAGKSPYVDADGFWVYYNDETGQYVTTDIKAQGKDGKSAYQEAVDNGFKGSVQEWLLSLQGKDWKVIDIDHIPTENDLTYTDETGEHSYPIGITIRYKPSDIESIEFYKLYAIEDGKAIWKVEGSGGASEVINFADVLIQANWTQDETGAKYVINNNFIVDGVFISIVVANEAVDIANEAGLLPKPSAVEGQVTIHSKAIPTAAIPISYTIIRGGGVEGGSMIMVEAYPGGGLEIVNGNQVKLIDKYLQKLSGPIHKTIVLEPSNWQLFEDSGLWMARIPSEDTDPEMTIDSTIFGGADDSTRTTWEAAGGINSISDYPEGGYFYAKSKKQPTGNILYKYTIVL